MSKSTTIITSTTALSSIASTIRTDAEKVGKIPSKQHILNTMARAIAGPKHDWGYLTGSDTPVVQKGMPAPRKNAASDTFDINPEPLAHGGLLLGHDSTIPALTVIAKSAPLFSKEMAAYLRTQFTDGFLAILDSFSTDADSGTGVQCMFEPASLCVSEDALSFTPKTLWGGSIESIERYSKAYFAANSDANVNDRVTQEIADWSDEAYSSAFKVFYLPNAIIISTDYPLDTLETLDFSRHETEYTEEYHDELSAAFIVIVDETLDDAGKKIACAEAEDLLLRLARFLNHSRPFFSNISVTPA